MSQSKQVYINEVGPRDGLQFEQTSVSLEEKYRLICNLADAGVKSIELGSIVTPVVKQMRGSDVLVDILCAEQKAGNFPDVIFQLLATNEKYAQAAIEAGISSDFGELAAVYGLTDENCQTNLKQPDIESAIQNLIIPMVHLAKSKNVPVRIYLSDYFKADPQIAAQHCKRMLDLGAYEVVPSDTTGVATCEKVALYIQALKQEGVSLDKIAFHFHGDTKQSKENIQHAYDLGIQNFDTAIGGIGGCKFAGKHVPNASTEDITKLFDDQNIDTGIKTKKLKSIVNFLSQTLSSEFKKAKEPSLFQAPNILNDGTYNFKNINIKIDERGVAYVALNRPKKHNAFDSDLIFEITQAFEQLSQNYEVRIIRLSGQGPSFCSGADLGYMKKIANYNYDENIADAKKLARMFEAIKKCPKAIIGAFHRNVIAGATGLASLCDYNIALAGTKFAISERHLGLRPSTISPHLISRIGKHNAAILFTEGNPFFTNRAKDYGLIEHVSLPGELEKDSEELISQILASTEPKKELHRLRKNISRQRNQKPFPVYFSKDTQKPVEKNHNKILDLVYTVEMLSQDISKKGVKKLINFTSKDIAAARKSSFAQQKLAKFLSPSP